jgi:hypothetical protein
MNRGLGGKQRLLGAAKRIRAMNVQEFALQMPPSLLGDNSMKVATLFRN